MKLQFVHRPYQGSIVKGLYIQCEEVGSTKSKGKLKTYLLHLWIADDIVCALLCNYCSVTVCECVQLPCSKSCTLSNYRNRILHVLILPSDKQNLKVLNSFLYTFYAIHDLFVWYCLLQGL